MIIDKSNTILICSDIHGYSKVMENILKIGEEQCGKILFAGDLGLERSPSIARLLRYRNIPFISVRGNCDSPWAFSDANLPIPPIFTSFKLATNCEQKPFLEIFMTHGHRYFDEESRDADIIVTGHTHVPQMEKINGKIYLNPGSASLSRSRTTESYMILTPGHVTLYSASDNKVLDKMSFKI